MGSIPHITGTHAPIAPAAQGGFSMLEFALGLVIFSIIMVPLLNIYEINLKQRAPDETRQALSDVTEAINQFYVLYKRYPCPAAVNLGEGNSNYGAESLCNAVPLCSANAPNWFDKPYDVTNSPGVCHTGGANDVVIGSVPFSTLGLSDKTAEDFWGRRLMYAVTLTQTDANNTNDGEGAITVRMKNYQDPPQPNPLINDLHTNDVDFFIYSTGEDGVGGFGHDGNRMAACGLKATGLDRENCGTFSPGPGNGIFDNIFINDINPEDSRVSTASTVPNNPYHYDDLTTYQLSVPHDFWFQRNGVNTTDSLADRVGIHTETPEFALDVNGQITTNANAKANELCQIDPITRNFTNCFNPESFVDNNPEMTCSNGGTIKPALQFGNGEIGCAEGTYDVGGGVLNGGAALVLPADKFKDRTTSCPAGIKNFDNDGVPTCAPYPPPPKNHHPKPVTP